jgi:hypothetical protein
MSDLLPNTELYDIDEAGVRHANWEMQYLNDARTAAPEQALRHPNCLHLARKDVRGSPLNGRSRCVRMTDDDG